MIKKCGADIVVGEEILVPTKDGSQSHFINSLECYMDDDLDLDISFFNTI